MQKFNNKPVKSGCLKSYTLQLQFFSWVSGSVPKENNMFTSNLKLY